MTTARRYDDLIEEGFTLTSEAGEDRSESGRLLRARRELALAIRRGEYQPNQRLPETELAATLGISRPTLRSVFVALEQENYISLERNRGARVRQFSPVEAIEILHTREILESAAAGLAAARITPEECERLEAILERMVPAAMEHDSPAYSSANREFHGLVINASRQPTLIRFIRSTPYPLVMSQYRDPKTPHPRTESLREHRAILAALWTGDSAATEAAMRFHLAATRRALMLGSTEAGGAREGS
jgi:DNA-binding GntR family transcriptional regulator